VATIGLSMIVKDEPVDRIAMLVDYLKPVVSQFAIVDTGSMEVGVDLPLYESWGVKTATYDWNNDFAAARNSTLHLLDTDWILHLDADELPTRAMMVHIEQVTEHGPAGVLGYRYFTRNFWGGELGIESHEHWHCRLFRREHGRWYKQLHEQVMLKGMMEHESRGQSKLVDAPKEAYLIHSKPRDQIEVSARLYERMAR
jgi:hypothetical protein